MQVNNYALTRRQLDGTQAPHNSLLELLATDDVYSFKDDFDRGLDTAFWNTQGSATVSDEQLFSSSESQHGWVVGSPGGVDDAAVWLWSPSILTPRNRPVVMARVAVGDTSDLKFEFGLGSPHSDPHRPDVDGFVNVKDTPTSNTPFAGNYAVICYDSDDDTSIDLVGRSNGTTTKGVRSGGPTVGFEFTLMLAMNDHGGVASWIDGHPAAILELQPFESDAAFGTLADKVPARSGRTLQDIRHGESESTGIWLFVQNRAANSRHDFWVDYIQTWEDRNTPEYSH